MDDTGNSFTLGWPVDRASGLRAVGIESTQALINTDSSDQLPELPVYGLFDHVITYIPSLKMYLDATSRFARFGPLPSALEGKPVLLTASGEIALPMPRAHESDVLRYQSNYELAGGKVKVTRHFQANRKGMVCGPSDDLDWEAFGRVVRQDLRQQIFFEAPVVTP